jgi:hypothetical protein
MYACQLSELESIDKEPSSHPRNSGLYLLFGPRYLGPIVRDSFLTKSTILHTSRTHTGHEAQLTFACGCFRGSSLGDRRMVGKCFSFTTSKAGCVPLSDLSRLLYSENVEVVAAGGGFLSGERAIGNRRNPFRPSSRCSLNTLSTTCSCLSCRWHRDYPGSFDRWHPQKRATF